jgi:hypothetical protein
LSRAVAKLASINLQKLVISPTRSINLGDKGMTYRPSIFTYLVFGAGRASTKEITRPTKIAA